ncbi:MAG: SOS response-associated peptidase [Ekhidna sp.]|nr:SOS response-associated peptidase [Ekhidna sp.]
MVDRYSITLNADELTLALGVEVPEEYQPQYNAAPTKSLPIITVQNPSIIDFQKWGLVAMWTNNKAMSPKFFNLPLASVLTKPSYRKKLKNQRCLIPMDGFFVWKRVMKRKLIPSYFFYPDKRVFCVAGIWEANEDQNAFIMITRPSNDLIAPFQDDMPAILDVAATKKWIAGEVDTELEELLQSASSQTLLFHTVSPRMSNIDLNNQVFIQPAPASDQDGNYTLFT